MSILSIPRDRAGLTVIAILAVTSCSVQLVAPYNADLAQKASSMEAEASSWDLTMRGGAGTIADDPRNPDVVAILNRWRGQADAMLTLAVSNDPGTVGCSQAAQAAYAAIESSIPSALQIAGSTTGSASNTSVPSGCEAALVADIRSGIDDIAKALKFCRANWVPDEYFSSLSQNHLAAAKPSPAPNKGEQDVLTRSCFAEFKEPAQPADPTIVQHGRAVSHLLTTLQVIVYVENRKKAAAASK